MSVPDLLDPECTDCSNYHTKELICEDCIKERIKKVFDDMGIIVAQNRYLKEFPEFKQLKQKHLDNGGSKAWIMFLKPKTTKGGRK